MRESMKERMRRERASTDASPRSLDPTTDEPGYATADERAGELGFGEGFRPGGLAGQSYYTGSRFGRGRRRSRHWGKAPKNYRRNDARVLEDVCDRLMVAELDPSGIVVEVREGEVILDGEAEDRETKLAAEAIADTVPGVHDVVNRIRIPRRE